MKWFNAFMLLLVVSSFSLVHAGDKQKARFEAIRKELNLSDEQLAQVKELRKSQRTGMKESKTKFKAAKANFKEAIKDPKVNDQELSAKFNAFQSARDEFQRQRFNMMLKMRKILSPEQLEKFRELRKRYKGKKRQ